MVRRLLVLIALCLTLVVALPAAAFACGGLVAGKHAEVLRRATTLAGWHDGIEHYVTGFEFAGSAESFGYIIPLPANPSKITKGGDWTLERLEREAFPPPPQADGAVFALEARAGSPVEVLQHVKVDSLDIKVVKGGGRDVAAWAKEHGFDLTPDTPKLLAAYTSDIFALAKFDNADAKKRFTEGQGVVIDFAIPLAAPWVPLRILSLGKSSAEPVDAHLFLLTDSKPMLSPAPAAVKGMRVVKDEWASPALIADLRSDKNTAWIPDTMWFTAIDLSAAAKTVSYDLAGVSGIVPVSFPEVAVSSWAWWLLAASAGGAIVGFVTRSRIKAGR